ncbi:CAP domain-containing protein [Paenibacillus sp. CMAA1364]
MKTTVIRKIMVGTVAGAIAIGISLPGSASAASEAINNNTTQKFSNFNSLTTYLQDWINNNGGKVNVSIDKVETITKPSTPVTKPNTPPIDATVDKSSVTSQVVELVNKERSKAGLKPLVSDAKLANMALDKAKDMSNNNYFAHQSPTFGSPFDMMKQYGISYSYAGENIAKGQKTPADVMQAWMNSEGHRANILSTNFTTIGVGYFNGHWVQEFISK